jgi:hypothetical protein
VLLTLSNNGGFRRLSSGLVGLIHCFRGIYYLYFQGNLKMDAPISFEALSLLCRFIRRHTPECSDLHIYLRTPDLVLPSSILKVTNFLLSGYRSSYPYYVSRIIKDTLNFLRIVFFLPFFGLNDTASTGLLNNSFLLLLTAMNKMTEKEIQGFFTFC